MTPRLLWVNNCIRDLALFNLVLLGSNPLVDDVDPVFTEPGDIELNATGYQTVVDLAPIPVSDQKDGNLYAYADKQSPLLSGHHEITWTVTDNAGNSVARSQVIVIIPLIVLGTDKVTCEVQSVRLPFT